MLKNCEKCLSQFSRTRSDIFSLLLLSNQQSKTQRLFIHYHKWQRKEANSHILEAGTMKMFDICALKMTATINRFNIISSLSYNTLFSWLKGCIMQPFCVLYSISHLKRLCATIRCSKDGVMRRWIHLTQPSGATITANLCTSTIAPKLHPFIYAIA